MPKLRIDLDSITLDTLDYLQTAVKDKSVDGIKSMRQILPAFMVSDSGEPMPLAEAQKAVGSLTFGQIKEAMSAIKGALNDMNEQAIPPETGSA